MYPRNTHAHVFILLADVPKHFLLCLKRVDIDISERAFREYICVCLHIYIYTCMSASPSVHMRLCRAYVCVYQRVRVNAGVNLCVFVLVCMCVCVRTDAPASGLKPGWACVYESRQCARGEQGSEKDVAAVGGGGRQARPRGPPLVDSLTDDMH